MTAPGSPRTPEPGGAAIGSAGDVGAGVAGGCGRVLLVLLSPRCAIGLLSWPAWDALHTADLVLAADPDPGWVSALAEAGVAAVDLGAVPVGVRARRLVEEAESGRCVVWFGSPDGDPGLTDALAERLSRIAIAADPPEVELVTGSYDVPGARLLDLVAVMDRLRSPGGCPWDAGQTHSSLLPYLLEETHEVVEAVETGDLDHLREELGDLLLQVVFHARVAQEDDRSPFGIDEVAAGIVTKLVNRHPHVFGDVTVEGPADVERNWEQLKAAEKGRTGVFDGIPATLPALARAQKMLSRLEKVTRSQDGVGSADDEVRSAGTDPVAAALAGAAAGDEVAETLLAAVRAARARGDDAESVLRGALRRLAATTADTPDTGADPAGADT